MFAFQVQTDYNSYTIQAASFKELDDAFGDISRRETIHDMILSPNAQEEIWRELRDPKTASGHIWSWFCNEATPLTWFTTRLGPAVTLEWIANLLLEQSRNIKAHQLGAEISLLARNHVQTVLEQPNLGDLS